VTGYHLVRRYLVASDPVALPEGWKPFAAVVGPDGRYWLFARKWVRAEVHRNLGYWEWDSLTSSDKSEGAA
jgi:streptogramin lyase